ncbi:hypothetical protein KIN20_012536 [Parelaphostrongylus tenuis]|uniref:Uncharacterized protein n=1 Tax=Parelaphostrongylus tenuis TaxID=148309 RepID=A0AAD5QKD0_PARTN|nr:hypothetical protein KIN20_012536 [Parelaphostrongylus tenuis]
MMRFSAEVETTREVNEDFVEYEYDETNRMRENAPGEEVEREHIHQLEGFGGLFRSQKPGVSEETSTLFVLHSLIQKMFVHNLVVYLMGAPGRLANDDRCGLTRVVSHRPLVLR